MWRDCAALLGVSWWRVACSCMCSVVPDSLGVRMGTVCILGCEAGAWGDCLLGGWETWWRGELFHVKH